MMGKQIQKNKNKEKGGKLGNGLKKAPMIELFACVNPLDYRYYGRDKIFEKAKHYLSEDARIRYQLKVECAVVKTLAAYKKCSWEIAKEVEEACGKVSTQEVYEEEDRIKHDIRALVNNIRKNVSDEAKPFVHFSLTSFDVIDTANALRFKEAVDALILPSLKELEKTLIELALREKDTVQIGRTHGQHAEPITFGFAISEYVSRLGNRIQSIEEAKKNLRGKISGAVGAYNASSLMFDLPTEFESNVLMELDLGVGTHSTQIVEPEYMLDLMHSVVSALGVIANLADDMRHLQRSEIGEVGEPFSADQVGSSTMPQKRNPINFENVKSFWKEFMPRMMTRYMDQISEHQRDLTNSASSRFIPEIMLAIVLSADRLNKIMKKLTVDKANMQNNFNKAKGMIIAEPLYILLASHGHPDAHEHVRKLTLEAQKTGKPLHELAISDESLKPYLEKMTPGQTEIIKNPEKYTGLSAEKAEQVCLYWKERLNL